MFTGIVEEIGSIAKIQKGRDSAELTIFASTVLEDAKVGDSIAVNGVCLTVTALQSGSFTADVMHETLNRSSLSQLHSGSRVNLERAMP
ncbi:MAG: riboflavin synthase, partial [Firmicutes bacterium]|nr:riboflavin synthase [Bacillota bacterium]